MFEERHAECEITYTLTPSVAVKVNVSEGLVLPEGIVFVENNLPTGQITLKKGKKYRYGAKIKTVEIGNWMIYASPGVHADVNIFEYRASAAIYKAVDATIPPLDTVLERIHQRRNKII